MRRFFWRLVVGVVGLVGLSLPAWGADTVYRCKAYSGGLFWSKQHCQEREALIDRMVSVPSGLSWAEQRRLAEQGTQSAAKESAAAEREERAQEQAQRQQQKAAQRHQKRCTSLQADLQHQESLERWGGTGRKMERVARKKQSLKEELQQAGC